MYASQLHTLNAHKSCNSYLSVRRGGGPQRVIDAFVLIVHDQAVTVIETPVAGAVSRRTFHGTGAIIVARRSFGKTVAVHHTGGIKCFH